MSHKNSTHTFVRGKPRPLKMQCACASACAAGYVAALLNSELRSGTTPLKTATLLPLKSSRATLMDSYIGESTISP